jgi:hypothetical protein
MNQRIAKAGRLGLVTSQTEKLPYSIELWDGASRAQLTPSLPARFFRRRAKSIPSRGYCCAAGSE